MQNNIKRFEAHVDVFSIGRRISSHLNLAVLLGLLFSCGCGDTAGGVNLWDAIDNDDPHAIEVYVNAGGDISHARRNGRTALLYAMENQQHNAYTKLLQSGADAHVRAPNEMDLVAWSIYSPEDFWLKEALDSGANPNEPSYSRAYGKDVPPLIFAIDEGSNSCVRMLIDAGADVDYVEQGVGTVLMRAAASGRFDVVLMLLEADANYKYFDDRAIPFIEFIDDLSDDTWVSDTPKHLKMRRELATVKTWLRERGVALQSD